MAGETLPEVPPEGRKRAFSSPKLPSWPMLRERAAFVVSTGSVLAGYAVCMFVREFCAT